MRRKKTIKRKKQHVRVAQEAKHQYKAIKNDFHDKVKT